MNKPAYLELISKLLLLILTADGTYQSASVKCEMDRTNICSCSQGRICPTFTNNISPEPADLLSNVTHDLNSTNVHVFDQIKDCELVNQYLGAQIDIFIPHQMNASDRCQLGAPQELGNYTTLLCRTAELFSVSLLGTRFDRLEIKRCGLDKVTEFALELSVNILTFLKLPWNQLVDDVWGSISKLTALKYMDLARNSLSFIPRTVIHQMPALEHVYLQGNRLTAILPGTFTRPGVPFQVISLQSNKISTLHDFSFLGTNVRSLSLVYNQLSNISVGAFVGLNVSELRMYSNDIYKLHQNTFRNISGLEALFLGPNQLNTTEWMTREMCSSLLDLDLRNNRFITFSLIDICNGSSVAFDLDISRNYLTKLELSNLSVGHSINLAQNDITEISGINVIQTQRDGYLNLKSNLLTLVPYIRIATSIAGKKHRIYLSFNRLRELPPITLEWIGSILGKPWKQSLELDVSNNNITSLENFPLQIISQGVEFEIVVVTLNLDRNEVKSVNLCNVLVSPTYRITMLSLIHNEIEDVIIDNCQGQITVSRLDLSYNKIRTFIVAQYIWSWHVVLLRLRGNRISALSEDFFSKLVFVVHLDLQQNNMTHLPRFNSTISTILSSLILNGNPLLCSCMLKDFEQVRQFSNPRCYNEIETESTDLMNFLQNFCSVMATTDSSNTAPFTPVSGAVLKCAYVTVVYICFLLLWILCLSHP